MQARRPANATKLVAAPTGLSFGIPPVPGLAGPPWELPVLSFLGSRFGHRFEAARDQDARGEGPESQEQQNLEVGERAARSLRCEVLRLFAGPSRSLHKKVLAEGHEKQSRDELLLDTVNRLGVHGVHAEPVDLEDLVC